MTLNILILVLIVAGFGGVAFLLIRLRRPPDDAAGQPLVLLQNQINEIFSIVKLENIKRIHIYKEQREEASKLAKIRNVPKRDALHAILSRDNHLQLISRDRHFEKLKDISKAGLPEEFI